VTLPEGTPIRALAISDRVEHDVARDFGLYLNGRWRSTWPSDTIDWRDFGLPTDATRAAAQILDAFVRAKSGEAVEVGCLGGLGRTGTVLACMAVLTRLDAPRPSPGSGSTTVPKPSRPPSGSSGSAGSPAGLGAQRAAGAAARPRCGSPRSVGGSREPAVRLGPAVEADVPLF
jgi:hypothetical protein